MPPLNAVRRPAGDGGDGAADLVLLHGFTQTGAAWGPFVDALGANRDLVLVDLPGHGGSDAVRADLPTAADLVLAAADAAGCGPAFDLCGYSLGGRVALHLALRHPDRVGRLVLLSATAGIEDDAARERRRQADEQMADDLEASGDVAGFVARWLAAPMFAAVPAERSGASERAANTATGLASSLRLAGTGTQEPQWGALGGLGLPVLAVAGADDVRFAAHARRLARLVPSAAFALVPGAGHAVHLQQPQVCARIVGRWLDVTAG